MTINRKRLIDTFFDLLRVDSVSGNEAALAAHLARLLSQLGATVRPDVRGNLLAFFDGRGAPILLSAHLDTVASTSTLKVVVENDVVSSDGSTILGADDKAGIAALIEAMRYLAETGAPRPPVELALTVGEEVGLAGSKSLDFTSIRARRGVCVDSGGEVGTIITEGPAQVFLNAVVRGLAAHAGVAPERGISAIVVASEAIAGMSLGRIDEETTANVGVISGGSATNVVPERVEIKAEARSRNEAKLKTQYESMIDSLERAAARHGASVAVDVEHAYAAFKLSPQEGIVRLVSDACLAVGLSPRLEATGGGSDANIFNERGIMTVNLGVGYKDPHAVTERIAIADLVAITGIVAEILSRAS